MPAGIIEKRVTRVYAYVDAYTYVYVYVGPYVNSSRSVSTPMPLCGLRSSIILPMAPVASHGEASKHTSSDTNSTAASSAAASDP